CQHGSGKAHLLAILADDSTHPEVRAAAARGLGAAHHQEAIAPLIRLLDDPSTLAALALGVCDGLGALGDRQATGALLRTVDRAGADVELTRAALRALGQIADPESSEPISRLLGVGALQRLQRSIEPGLLQQSSEACLYDPGLPRPIAIRLALALES